MQTRQQRLRAEAQYHGDRGVLSDSLDPIIPRASGCRRTFNSNVIFFLAVGSDVAMMAAVVAVAGQMKDDENQLSSAASVLSRATDQSRLAKFEQQDLEQVSVSVSAVNVVNVKELSRRLPGTDPYSNITTALCCKAMFGNVDMNRVALWVAYNRLLGFDHFFLYYHDVIADFPGFDELQSLPYLTMTPMKGKVTEFRAKSQNATNGTRIPYSRFAGESLKHRNQNALERECFNKHAHDYDWVSIVDIDEYLSFNEEIGVKDFIAKYSDDSTKSIGIGKKMYTLSARAADTVDSGFGLDEYPFSPGIYCTSDQPLPKRNRKQCSGYYGSTKLILRPQNHSEGIGTHGPRHPNRKAGEIQINTDIAHFMEYPFMHQRVNATYHEKEDFLVTSGVGLRLTNFDNGYQPNENGTWTIQYDNEPSKWYKYVASRGLDSSPKSLL
jgi:hypothetical protein